MQSQRFGSLLLHDYVKEIDLDREMQFSAICIDFANGTYVSYCGTDDTLVGWKEDFNMSILNEIPSQQQAVEYLTRVGYQSPQNELYVGGHSKGGNLAVYASIYVEESIQNRIVAVYNNDGPGFTGYMMGDPGYLAMVPRIKTYIPQSSVIGMLLEHEEPYTVIKSKSVSLLQHDPYSWELLGREFVQMQDVTEDSQFLDTAIKTWFAEMTNQERNQLVDVMFTLLDTGNIENVLDIFHPKNTLKYLKTLSADDNMRKILSGEFQSFVEAAKKTRSMMDAERTAELLPEAEI